jgi:hypothetical protein
MGFVSISCLLDIYCSDYKRYSRLNLLEDGTKEIELDNKKDDSVEITNKMQPCNRIYYSTVH